MLAPILTGGASLLFAAICVVSWVAVGSLARPPRAERIFMDLAVCILVGSTATSIGYSLFSLAGNARAGAIIGFLAPLVVAGFRRKRLVDIAGRAIAQWRSMSPESRVDRIALGVALAVLCVCATAPPRDGDVLRYHLAHIGQIAADGSWVWIPDFMYALPFAWSFNYLPFAAAHLPQGAAFLNTLLWLGVVLLVVEAASAHGVRKSGLLIALCFMAHPYIIKVFSAAFPDGYTILISSLLGVLVMRLSEFEKRDWLVLGFVAWIGVSSRYQMVAISLAATAVASAHLIRARDWKATRLFVAGAVTAVVANCSFYLVNWKNVGNPFWPLPTPLFPARGSFVQALGTGFASQFTWPAREPLTRTATRLLSDPSLAPIPFALLVLSVLSVFWGDRKARRIGLFGCIYLGLWVAMSPRLYPTHILPLVGLGPIMVLGLLSADSPKRAVSRALTLSLRAASFGFIALSLVFAWDYARYDVTGNAKEFHRFTWYYPVYDWVNRNTPSHSKFLVVVFSGSSYYLDRPYRRADPWLSAEIDWSRVGSPVTLDSIMKKRDFDYLIYDDRYWNQYAGGKMMTGVVHSAVSRKILIPVYHSREKLYSGRITRRYSETDVYVYRRASAQAR